MSSTQKKHLSFPIILLLSVFCLLSSGIRTAGAATVALAWDRSNDQEVIGYRVHYGISRGIYQHSVDVQNNTSCSISELSEGTTYYFAATAYNDSNVESGYSEEIAHTIPNPSSQPPTIDTDGDGLFDDDETDIYGTNPNNADTDGDGINDGEELTFWGDNWSEDSDGDGLVNLVDPDSDNDGYNDGTSPPPPPPVETDGDGIFDDQDNSIIPHTHLSIISVDSEETIRENNAAVNAIDGSANTIWHTEWYDSGPEIPHEIVIDLGGVYEVNGIQYLPRQDGGVNGTVAEYEFYVAADTLNWGQPVTTGAFAGNTQEKEETFTGKIGRYVRFVALSEINGQRWTSMAEINIRGSEQVNNDGMSPPPPPPPPADTDGDGILDDDESGIYGTDPNSVDTDGDGMNDGDEVSDGYDPLDPSSRPASNFLTFEIGDIQLDHNWIRVNFRESYVDPIVVARPASINGSDPAVIRIRNIDTSGFDIRIQEWDYLDGSHTIETVSFFVMEKGSFTLDDGTQIEAGRFETDKTGSFGDFNFSQNFQEAPVVLASISSLNETDAVTGRLRNISNQGFEFCMQEQELNPKEHLTETVDYIAWQTSKGNLNGYSFEVGKTANNVKDAFNIIEFNQSFGSVPHFLADMQTTDGKDTANIRWQNKNSHSVEVQIDEEQSKNAETRHTTEVIGYMVFGY